MKLAMQLDQIYFHIWQCLAAAARADPQPFGALQAATVGLDDAPNVRTVALRRVSEPDNLIVFHTDRRSPKIAELSRVPRIALVGIDPDRSRQIRVTGQARIVRDGPALTDAWRASCDHDLIQYRTALAPGTPISEPRDAFGERGEVPGPDEGFRHFCIVEVHAASIDWLDLSAPDRPERARFVRNGDAWTGSWVAP